MGDNVSTLNVIFTEFYYWVTVVFMFLIHVGFCMYEVGASRRRNHMHTLMKNTMAIPLITVTFFFFGWWIYFAFPSGLYWFNFVDDPLFYDPNLVAGPASPLMGTHLSGVNETDIAAGITADGLNGAAIWHRLNGVFWAAFLLFSITTASIVSGAVIERIKMGAFWMIAVLLGSVLWITDAAWGWSAGGWMVKYLGYHDAYASGVVHGIAGGAALATLIVLGPRLGKFRPDGTPRDIPPHNPWLVTIGLFLIYTGFWGFYAACNIPMISPGSIAGQITGETWTTTNIYLTPTTLSAITMNFLMALSGGMMAGYIFSKGDAFWTYSAGLCGIIGASAGNDLYHPIQAMFIGAIVPYVAYKLHFWVERTFKIDDAVGAVAVHGYGGFMGVVIAGFVLWGAPSSPYEGYAVITPWGNFIGGCIMVLLGFVPVYILCKILNSFGLLRIPAKIELEGLDFKGRAAYEAAVAEITAAERAMLK
ncbi:MAG: ammonium transporter [Rhodobacteraceae bacterium]|jgi:Amt family ammonium transporter|nr:ammonium transporter [Paracoccaceae bacterium]MCZ8335373.1 ammonium transporter [Paracoccaceae bacterium]